MRTQEKIEALKIFAQELKANGFTVIISKKHPFQWIHFFKDGKMGYVDGGTYSAFNFSSEHKPSREHGTGLGTASQVNLTIENATDAINAKGWAAALSPARKLYASPEEFINHTSNKWAEYYIL